MSSNFFGLILTGLSIFFSANSAVALENSQLLPPIQVILVGDSTLAPKNGYGDALCTHFLPQVNCVNLAKNGRSSGSYREEGSWQVVLDLLTKSREHIPTYVLIEFGHNDQPGKPGRSTDLVSEFPRNLMTYVQDVRALGGIPILVTPLTRRNFKGDQLIHDLEPWADATRRVASNEKVPLLELLAVSSEAVQAMGHSRADTLAVEIAPVSHRAEIENHALPGDFVDLNSQEPASNKKSAFDHTHVGPLGAQFFAQQVETLIRQTLPELSPYFLD